MRKAAAGARTRKDQQLKERVSVNNEDLDDYLAEQLKDPVFALQYELACRDWDWVSPRPVCRKAEEKSKNGS